MIDANSNMWVIAVTFQGGGVIDEILGPYWNHTEAERIAVQCRDEARPRHDMFEVYLLTGDFS